MLEFVEIQLAETNSKLSKMGQPFRVMNFINRFCKGGGGRIIDKIFFLKTTIEGATLSSGSSLFHSDRQFG